MKILLLLLAPLAWGQVEGIPRRFDEVYHSPGAGQKTFPTGVAAGYTVTVIDGNAAGPCTTGGGSTKSQCRYSGSVWQSVGPASAGGGDAQTASPLSQFAPTTSSQLRSVISDETGGDAAVFATSPTITTPSIAGLTGTGTADFSGATAVIMARGTAAPSSGTCDAAAEEGSIYIRTDNPATNPTQAYHCAKTGASSWAWHLISHKVGATDPAKCDEGQIFYNTTSDTLRACTAADTWAAVGGSGGGDALTANPLSQFASTSSSQLRGVLNDETGAGPAVFGTSPTIDGLVGTGAVSFGSTTGLLLRFGTTAPSSADCDSAGERGAVYVQSGNPATVATRLLICTQTGASSYAWMPSSHKVEATDPATCTEGDLFYNTTSDTLRVCTATDTWGAIGGGAGSYTQSFTAQTSVTLSHSLGTKNLVVNCYDGSDNLIEWNTFVTTSTSAAAVTFTTAQTGRCVVAGGLAGAGDALTADPLSQFATTTPAQLRTVMTGGTSGTGDLLFAGGNIGAATGTSLDLSGALEALSVAMGSSPPSVTAGTGGVQAMGEGTAPSAGCPAVGVDCVYADSTAHALLASYNNDAVSKIMRASDVATGYQPLDAALTALAGGSDFVAFSGPSTSTKTFTLPNASATLSYTIASGAKALATSAISSATCTSAQTDTATGTATTDAITASFSGDPTAVTGYVPLTTGMLTIIAYPTADTVNFKVCNNTSSSITPGAITLNWRVVR